MKKGGYMMCVLCLIIILNGCTNEQNDESSKADESVIEIENGDMANNIETVDEKENEILETDSELNSDEMMEKLGSDIVTEKKVEDEKECDEGFIYHTELKECFKIGGITDSENEKVEIDPVVQECNDKGGIYNAQIEKCFVD